MKKLINDPRRVVREMLEGLADITPGIALLDNENVVIRANLPEPARRGVAVVSGGGAGHEPAHAGYVGAGMLHAAVVGDVFTSPSVDAVLAAIQEVAGPAGVVLVVKNYTGDRLNFGLAAEMARAAGIPAEIVVVADDVALRETVEPSRRRGIAGTVLIHKIAGAAAEAGAQLHDVAEAARQAAASLGSMGVALGACTVPAAGTPSFALAEDEIELGLGIHGEPGVQRAKIQPVDRLVEDILNAIIEDRGIASGDRVALLVNGLGGTPPMELAIVARAAMLSLGKRGIVVERAWSGTLLSALEMPGVSLSLLAVNDARTARLDAATTAPAWPGSGVVPGRRVIVAFDTSHLLTAERYKSHDTSGPVVLEGALACAAALEGSEKQLTELDSAVGDGDLGISMTRGAAAIRTLSSHDVSDAASTLTLIADVLRRAIGGSSGPFYAVGLLRAAEHLASGAESGPAAWAEAFEHAVVAIAELGGAKRGDCTMLDALYPAVDALKAGLQRSVPVAEAWSQCVLAAEEGAAATATMRPRLGRAAYLGDRAVGLPDGGAVAVTIWLRALTAVIK
ncbi:MAG: dihydroxyacetone kinase family protein [Rhodopila sp.]